jgi:hypothetical protein
VLSSSSGHISHILRPVSLCPRTSNDALQYFSFRRVTRLIELSNHLCRCRCCSQFIIQSQERNQRFWLTFVSGSCMSRTILTPIGGGERHHALTAPTARHSCTLPRGTCIDICDAQLRCRHRTSRRVSLASGRHSCRSRGSLHKREAQS